MDKMDKKWESLQLKQAKWFRNQIKLLNQMNFEMGAYLTELGKAIRDESEMEIAEAFKSVSSVNSMMRAMMASIDAMSMKLENDEFFETEMLKTKFWAEDLADTINEILKGEKE